MRLGFGGPVGSGKTRLVERLLPLFAARGISVAVITNDLV
ncbi:GTP-binding protein, partial [Enterobacter asburiae]